MTFQWLSIKTNVHKTTIQRYNNDYNNNNFKARLF